MRIPEVVIKYSVLACFGLISCVPYFKYTPDPKKDIGQWVKNFERQRSFSYEYRMKTRTTDVTGRGECVIGWSEHIKGRWQSAASIFNFEYLGVNDLEFSRKDGGWIESARGEESNIYAQIQRMLSFDKFDFLEYEPKYRYRFKANVPFLAPDKWKEMIGSMIVSPKNYLPTFIWAGLPDSSVFWQVRITGYNKTGNIAAPVAEWTVYRLAVDSAVDLVKLMPAIKRRIALIGIPCRLEAVDRGLTLAMPAGYKTSDIGDLFTPGRVKIHWLTTDKAQAARIGYLMDDLKKPLLLTGVAIESQAIKDCRLLFDRAARPYLQLIMKTKLDRPGSLCLEIDSLMVAQMTIDKGQNMGTIRVDVDMGYYQMNIIRAAIIQPLPPIYITPAPGE